MFPFAILDVDSQWFSRSVVCIRKIAKISIFKMFFFVIGKTWLQSLPLIDSDGAVLDFIAIAHEKLKKTLRNTCDQVSISFYEVKREI